MSEILQHSQSGLNTCYKDFDHAGHMVRMMLPYNLDALLSDAQALVRQMIKTGPTLSFTRDEWAYLIHTFQPKSLISVFTDTFGPMVTAANPDDQRRYLISRETATVWLPNNVSLLGPLMVNNLLLAGLTVFAKSGSHASPLLNELQSYISNNAPNGTLKSLWQNKLRTEQFDRKDPRNETWSYEADVRLAFGNDTSIQAIKSLPSKSNSPFFGFGDHSSEIWISPKEAATSDTVQNILNVFRIYGKRGCTSPARVVIIDGTVGDAQDLALKLQTRWNEIKAPRPAPHLVSETIMADQVARASGAVSFRTHDGGAVFIAGDVTHFDLPGQMTLPIMALDIPAALSSQKANIQTVGVAADDGWVTDWKPQLITSGALRVVSVQKMHYFGPHWDGMPYWRSCFREIETSL